MGGSIPETLRTEFLQDVMARTLEPSGAVVSEILARAGNKKGLALRDVGYLSNLKDPALIRRLFSAAAAVKREIYGERLVFFAPLYISDHCVNSCEYCNFHAGNRRLERRKLTMEEVGAQAAFLINQGHKRVLLEAGEDPANNSIDYITDAIRKIYSVRTPKGNIRRINVNIAATGEEEYRKLKEAGIGTYQLFQETYHRPTYERLHRGPKADYERQLTAHQRAIRSGIDDIGLGALFGLYDWRFEALALVAHSQHLDETCKAGPHTISIPRVCAAPAVKYKPQYPLSDGDFLKLIAILRLAVPYTGIIISTRERPALRKLAFKIGVSQASAGSVTVTGGYGNKERQPQFEVNDERSLREVINTVVEDRIMPSFCTACYRTGRTGEHFMSLAKPGGINRFCRSNAIITFAEYMADCGDAGLREKGWPLIEDSLGMIEEAPLRLETRARLGRVAAGERDIYF